MSVVKQRRLRTGTMILSMKLEQSHFYLYHTDLVTGVETLVAANDDAEVVNKAFNKQVELDKRASDGP